jgi:glycosyltransferase involved in cell wall biosynthesis
VTKAWLLAGADALLFPIDWEEPFGLVMVEALACGTPIVAFRRGSVPEIVDNGTTGYVVDDTDAMVRALRFLPLISRRRCRIVAESRFDVRRMVDDYVAHYEALVDGSWRDNAVTHERTLHDLLVSALDTGGGPDSNAAAASADDEEVEQV